MSLMAPSAPGPTTERDIADRERRFRESARTRSPSLAADLDRLFEANRKQIRHLCVQLCGDPQRAEEIVQETLLIAYDRLPEFHGGARFSTWIYGIARNLCLNARRKRRDVLTEDGVIEAAGPAGDVLGQLSRQQRDAIIGVAAKTVLTSAEQEAVHMRYVLDAPLDRIEGVLSLRPGQARVVLQRSRRKLGVELQRLLNELGASLFFPTS